MEISFKKLKIHFSRPCIKSIKKIVALFTLLFCQMGCQDPTALNEDPMELGYQRLDRGDFDGAIFIFQNEMKQDPHDTVRMALASAYAGRAGVEIHNFWNFVQAMRG